MNVKTIVLVDDHVIVRNGLKELIEKLGEFKIVREFDSGDDFLKDLPLEPKPDLVMMDLTMPGLSGDEVMEKLNEMNSDLPVLILTLNAEEAAIVKLFRNGARGYLRKDCSAEELRSAINSITTFGYHHNEFLTYSLRNNFGETKRPEYELILDQMSARERQFLKWVCHEDEYTYDQIASLMEVTARTVDGYRESLFDKFAIKSKTGLVLFVLKHKLFDLL